MKKIIEVKKEIRIPQKDYDIILEAGDQIIIKKKFELEKISEANTLDNDIKLMLDILFTLTSSRTTERDFIKEVSRATRSFNPSFIKRVWDAFWADLGGIRTDHTRGLYQNIIWVKQLLN